MVVVTWRGRDLIGRCLDALAAQRPHRLLVVDNASTDGTAEVLAARCAPTVRLRRNAGYAGALAAALPLVTTAYVAWLNDDAEPGPGWLAALESTLDSEPLVAAAGSVMVDAGGAVLSAGVRLTPIGYGADLTADLAADQPADLNADLSADLSADQNARLTADRAADQNAHLTADQNADRSAAPDVREVFGFTGGAALLRAAALRAAGGVPAGFFCYYEDTDTSWRLRLAGHRVVTVPAARVRHRHGASTAHGSRSFHRWNERNRLLMLVRCAPAAVAARELARFAAITALLPLRRQVAGANFRLGLRLRVLAEVAGRLPAALVARSRIGRLATVPRSRVWQRWSRYADTAS